MSQMFMVLLTGHLLGDFVFQTDNMARDKEDGNGLIKHSVIVTLISWVLLGLWPLGLQWVFVHFDILALVFLFFVLHFLIDGAKSVFGSESARTFIIDQLLHLAAIVLLAAFFGYLMEVSWWKGVSEIYYKVLAITAGLILVTRFGSILIVKVMKPVLDQLPPREEVGLKNGGKWIGMLERALTFLLVLAGQYAAIGFLFAAKSILRFGEIKEPGQRKEAEYIIIGTFMSFGWALAVSLLFDRFVF